MWNKNVYNNPSAYNLTLIAEIDYSSGSYEFDLRVVWKDNQGNFWTARDSGCSCPSPFEDFNGLPDLDKLDLASLFNELREERNKSNHYISQQDTDKFYNTVYEAVHSK